ncbi:hypothetical protein ACFSSA_06750 [Luteolibacter algae]|uniref:DUF5666 domain-containing protein n=1 Tax=Luteolibacter algae TaxID=454151 RepID=A0ABW5D8J4_9BACT
MKIISTLSLSLAALLMTACEKKEVPTSAQAVVPDVSFEKYFTDTPPEGAREIHTAVTSVKPGDEITLSGELMGREKVFVDGRASFILGDPAKLTTCDKNPGDSCATPWDACCDSNELKRGSIAAVQILGEDGRVLSGNLKGVNGLKELSVVKVSGTVDKSSTADNLVLNASKIFVEKP